MGSRPFGEGRHRRGSTVGLLHVDAALQVTGVDERTVAMPGLGVHLARGGSLVVDVVGLPTDGREQGGAIEEHVLATVVRGRQRTAWMM